MGNLDLSFISWDIISKFVLNGFLFSVQLTIVATLGGIVFGTLLALMRLSGKAWMTIPATVYVNGMRSIPQSETFLPSRNNSALSRPTTRLTSCQRPFSIAD